MTAIPSSLKKNQSGLLENLPGNGHKKRREVIYGVYDSRQQPFLTRIDDFLIDHSRIPLQEKAYFFHLLAVMIDAGIPLIQSLKILAQRTANERMYRVLNTVAFLLAQGQKLSEAMGRFPDIFGEMELGVIRSGEAAGNLEKMLFKLSSQLDKSHALQMKLVTASIYPLAVLSVLLVVAGSMLIWVIPSLVNLLTEAGLEEADFPFATRLLIGISSFLTSYWWALIGGIFLFSAGIKTYIASENGRFRWDLLKIRVPIIGVLLRKVLVLRFISMLGILVESGLPVVQALTIIATAMTNELYRLKVWDVISKVQQGEKISESLGNTPFLFPETVSSMLRVGEQSASLGSISEKIGDHYDREISNSVKRLTSIFEPIMIVFVGASVALLALAILTPIFKLTQMV